MDICIASIRLGGILRIIILVTDWPVIKDVVFSAIRTLTGETDTSAVSAPRRRLPADVRAGQILDAALVEFSACGYAAARMDDIARRCGLSKGGIYVHFKAKDELFAALLERSLTPQALDEAEAPAALGPRALAEWLVDNLYSTIGHPGSVATLRLLIAEGDRVPALVSLWQQNVIQPRMDTLARIVQSQPWAQGSVLACEPWLVISPLVHALVAQLVPSTCGPHSIEDFRKGHVTMLCALLEERAAA